MYTAAELIHALQRRLRVTAYRNRPGEFPAAWQAWFDRMGERLGIVTGAAADSIIAVFQARPLATPPSRALLLGRWQAFATVWRQQWQPAAPDERWLRLLSAVVSGLVHLVFAVLLVWLGLVQYTVVRAPPLGEEAVIQVEYIGTATPEDVGGGEVPEQPAATTETTSKAVAESAEEPSPPAPAAPVTPPEPQEMSVPEVVQREVLEPTPTQQQRVTTSAPAPDTATFVLPPPTRKPPEPGMEAVELPTTAPPVKMAEVPTPLQRRQAKAIPLEVTAPGVPRRIPEVVTRDIPEPVRQPTPARRPAPTITVPDLVPEVPQVSTSTIPSPAPPAAKAAESDASGKAKRQSTQADRTADQPSPDNPDAIASKAAAGDTGKPADTRPGAGPKAEPAPGGWPSPKRADDWGISNKQVPGKQKGEPPGLYDSDGSMRLADTPGSAAPGQPPGTISADLADLDRKGTWLKRPPINFEPSTFAKYWRPSETLLEEWVRKSVTTIRIPVPGTNKHIVCQTVLLAMGGGCTVTDPNLNEQPATARPPPDIPFKPELQEDNGSVPAGG